MEIECKFKYSPRRKKGGSKSEVLLNCFNESRSFPPFCSRVMLIGAGWRHFVGSTKFFN